MPPNSRAHLAEAERAELERAAEALAKWPRLSRLLRYMAEKLSAGETQQLNQYNIATEVLGRSKNVFNADEDAIARVETHRLRKRLTEFYEKEGRAHPIQVTLPAGSYVPVFVHKPEEKAKRARLFANWKYLGVAAGILILASAAYVFFRNGHFSNRTSSETSVTSSLLATASLAPQSGAASAPVRLLAGYSGPPRTDSAGHVWSPDQFFSGGGSWQRAPEFLAGTGDPFIFEYSRTGDFSYNIPLKPGLYELHLLFSTPIRSSDTVSTFNMTMNGEWILQGFDINEDAFGENIADERVFRDVSPGKDGFLHLNFSGATGTPTINALEILPGVPHAQLPVRLTAQTTPFTDSKGRFWRPDDYFVNGRLRSQPHPLQDSADPDLFAGERYGHFNYAIPVDTRDRYTLILHFVELYFGPGASGNGGVGNRVFKVMCNGETLLDNFDIFKEAGSLHEVSKTFHHLKPSPQGKLNLTFEPIKNNATISGIEVLDESNSAF